MSIPNLGPNYRADPLEPGSSSFDSRRALDGPERITMQDQKDEMLAAYEQGKAAALAAASWVIDGNTPLDAIRRTVALLDEGDDIDPYLPLMPNLSGEWADDPTPMSLYREITGRDPDDPADGLAFETLHGVVIDALADEFERGVSDHFVVECERIMRAAIS